jgi:hypothetical protein
MLALSNPPRAAAAPFLLPANAPAEAAIGPNAAAPHKFMVGKWTITVSECGDDMLRLAIDNLADPANPSPIKLAAAADQVPFATSAISAQCTRFSLSTRNVPVRIC